jgi:hypothetical protein
MKNRKEKVKKIIDQIVRDLVKLEISIDKILNVFQDERKKQTL